MQNKEMLLREIEILKERFDELLKKKNPDKHDIGILKSVAKQLEEKAKKVKNIEEEEKKE